MFCLQEEILEFVKKFKNFGIFGEKSERLRKIRKLGAFERKLENLRKILETLENLGEILGG